MPSDFTFKAMNAVHRTVLKLTGGKAGWSASSMPVVQLTTVGRKTGQPRTVLLTSPVQEDGTIVVVASRGGDDQSPAWLHNVKANPQVRVVFAGQPEREMTARVADAAERERLWPEVTKVGKQYADYQNKTEREIALVLLEPAK
ncbi:MAG TPA: nitroreductase/quinone reductase family protein [Pseudonocardiaceae bacterium]|nr:nitroreductase/quinone reductase family protein [Pseudonocardiaceae bacterium]